jgi:hypothetical protein
LELLDPALAALCQEKPVARAQARGALIPQKPALKSRRNQTRAKECQCGSCARCRENAIWERIFREKFV